MCFNDTINTQCFTINSLRNVGLISCFEFLLVCFVQKNNEGGWLELLCLTPLSTIFQLYCSVQKTGVPGENHQPAASH